MSASWQELSFRAPVRAGRYTATCISRLASLPVAWSMKGVESAAVNTAVTPAGRTESKDETGRFRPKLD